MATNINSQAVHTYAIGSDGSTFEQEVINQQLNEALEAGTVEGILMKSGYVAQSDYNVAIKRDLANFSTFGDVQLIVDTSDYNFGGYDSEKTLQVKHNLTPTTQRIPLYNELDSHGEIVADNYDGSIYLLGNKGLTVQKVDAGTVNGFIIQRDVLIGGDTGMLTQAEVKALINSAFVYDAANNSLTIRSL